jgi:hypothetical protein
LCWAIQPPKSFRKRFDLISLSKIPIKEHLKSLNLFRKIWKLAWWCGPFALG